MKKLPIGIDISKATLDYHVLKNGQNPTKGAIDNTVSAIMDFLGSHDPQTVFLVAEPTGTYGDKLFELAVLQGFEIRLANPHHSSKYSAILGIINKTDENAAYVLAQMGAKLELPAFRAQSKTMKERKQIQMTLNALSKQCRMLENQIHAMEQRLAPSGKALGALKKALQALQEQKQTLEDDLLDLTDEEMKEFSKYARSVKGIGQKTADLLMIYTNGLKYFDKKSQLPKFVGTICSTQSSGSSINLKGPITKNGPSILRACLYNAATSAKRFNNACKALYERLRRNGKPHKVAMMAVINKLLHQVFAVVKSKTLFDNERYLINA